MTTPPPPLASPEPPRINNDRPSGSHNISTIREAVVIADAAASAAVGPVAKATKLQWIGISLLGGLTLGSGSFLAWCLITIGALNNAQAQTKATADQALELAKSTRAEAAAYDAGARVEVSNLRKELSEDRADTKKQLTDMQVTLNQILRAKNK